MPLRSWILDLVGHRPRSVEAVGRVRGPAVHVIILDGTMSSLEPGQETNAGIAFGLLREVGHRASLTVHYEAGIQWEKWSDTYGVMTGKGINRQIERAYGVLASRYRPGDRIILMGYSRGAYAVRSLAGIVDMVGLVRHDAATVRVIRQAYRHYRTAGRSASLAVFRQIHCHPRIEIEAIGVWDTVRALGARLPILWRWAEAQHSFHNDALGPSALAGYHALAIDETRESYAPVMWSRPTDWAGTMEQVWFRGTHGDIGGQLGGRIASRPLSNIPLVWMLEQLQKHGLPLPEGWNTRFACDPHAPSVGTWQGWAKLFWSRRRRIVGRDRSERLHETVIDIPAGALLTGRAGQATS